MADKVLFTIKALRLKNKNPEIEFCGKLITLVDDYTVIPVDVCVGLNLIEIKFLNKTNRDTKVIDGQIVEDLAVIIEKIEYKGFNFHTYIESIGNYIDNQGNNVNNTYGFMAFNGTLTIKLIGPLFVYSRDLAIQYG